jgi:hypothetical protein
MVLSKGFASFAGVSWGDVWGGIKALMAFGALAAIMGVLWEVIGIGELIIAGLGLSLMVFAAGAMLGAKAMDMLGTALPNMVNGLKSLNSIGLGELMKDVAKLGILTSTLGAMAVFAAPLMIFASAMTLLAAGISPFVEGLKSLETLNFSNTIIQLNNLSKCVTELSKTFSNIPDVKIEKLKSLVIPDGNGAGDNKGTEKKGEFTSDILSAIKDGIEGIRNDFKNGTITANVFLDSQKLDSAVGRRLSYTGTLT